MWLRKYKDRLDYVHFKDIDPQVYDEVMHEHIRFFEGCAKGSMCPIGQGMIDYKAVADVLDEIDYNGYITIEQECDPPCLTAGQLWRAVCLRLQSKGLVVLFFCSSVG